MTDMTTKQLRELDTWIAEHVMGWYRADGKPSHWFPDGYKNEWHNPKGGMDTLPCFTTDPAAAMTVLEKCNDKLKELGHFPGAIDLWKPFELWKIQSHANSDIHAEAETLPLAICLFAKQLFSK